MSSRTRAHFLFFDTQVLFYDHLRGCKMLQVVETMEFDLDNVRISKKTPIMTPREVRNAFPLSHKAKQTVLMGRKEIENIIIGRDNRFLMIVGPCSIHDPESAYEYAARLNELRLRYADKLCVIMRSYFE